MQANQAITVVLEPTSSETLENVVRRSVMTHNHGIHAVHCPHALAPQIHLQKLTGSSQSCSLIGHQLLAKQSRLGTLSRVFASDNAHDDEGSCDQTGSSRKSHSMTLALACLADLSLQR
jgi:hypothetical protein